MGIKVAIEKNQLALGLSRAGLAVASKTVSPLLVCVCVEARKPESGADVGRLIISGTDQNQSVRVTLPARVESEGVTIVPARMLTDWVDAAAGEISITSDLRFATVTCPAGQVRLNAYDDEFPLLDSIIGPRFTTRLEINSATLRQMTRYAGNCVVRDMSKPILRGVLLRSGDERVTMASTDSFRCADMIVPSPGAPDASAILPLEAIHILETCLPDNATVEIGLGQGRAIFVIRDGTMVVEVSTLLIDGTYPPYERIMPKLESMPFGYRVLKSELSGAIMRLSVVIDAKSDFPGVKMEFGPAGLALAAFGVERGTANEKLAAEPLDGKRTDGSVSILVNLAFLSEMVTRCGPVVDFYITSANSPMLILTPTVSEWRGLLAALVAKDNGNG